MIARARLAAYEIGKAVSSGRADLSSAAAQFRATLSDDRDRALASEIASGVQRWRLTLDHLVQHFAKRPLQKLDPEVVEVLRLGAYQLLHLTRVPASAVVDDAVKMARRVGKGSASGFVNAVLRTLSRARKNLPLPRRPNADDSATLAIDYLSLTLSHPRWLAERWHARLGLEGAERWMTFNNQAAPLTLRPNLLRTTAASLRAELESQGVAARAGRFAPDAIVTGDGAPLRTAEVDAGSYVVQDEASQLVTLLAGPRPGRRVLDTCASPGGKATALAAAVGGHGLVVACDVRERRMTLLASTVRATGAQNIRLVQADLRQPLPFVDRFDCVFVDAPCSGLGTLRRDPDIKWRRQESDLTGLASAQLQMLKNASAVVAPGGRLIYATCSSEPEENERVVDAFQADTRGFSAVDAGTIHSSLPHSVVDARGHLRTMPDPHELEGFFGAVFERLR